jgi:transposase
MDAHLFCFDDEQWAKIKPHLPKVQPGPRRKDDRRILSGIMQLKVGCRWIDCPKEGPSKTIYNRFARWSERGIWQRIFEAVATPTLVKNAISAARARRKNGPRSSATTNIRRPYGIRRRRLCTRRRRPCTQRSWGSCRIPSYSRCRASRPPWQDGRYAPN